MSPKSQILKKIRNGSQHTSLILGELYNLGDLETGEYHILLGAEFATMIERCNFNKNEKKYLRENFIEMTGGSIEYQPINIWKLIRSHYSEYSKFLVTYIKDLKKNIRLSYKLIVDPYAWKEHFSFLPE